MGVQAPPAEQAIPGRPESSNVIESPAWTLVPWAVLAIPTVATETLLRKELKRAG